MAVVFQGSTTAVATAGVLNINKPAGTAVGDLLVLHARTNQPISRAGWTQAYSVQDATAGYMTMLYRVADGTEGSTIQFTVASSGVGTGVLGRISGEDTTTPLDLSPSVGTWTAASQSSVTAPAITTVSDDCMIISQYAVTASVAGAFSTTGPTEQYEVANTLMAATQIKAVAGLVAAQNATFSGQGRLVGAQVAIRPPPPPPPPSVPRVGMIGI